MLRDRILLLLTTAVAPAAWGLPYLTTTELLPPDRPLLAAVVRALPAGLLLVAVSRRLPHGSWWWRAAVLGLLNIGLFFALLFVGAYRLPGGVAAVAGAVQPLVVAGLAAGLLGEKLRLQTVLTGLAGMAGVAMLVLNAQARLDVIGVAAALGGAVSMAVGVVLTKRWGRPAPLLAMTGWQLVAGGVLLVPVAVLVEGAPPALSPTNAAGFVFLGGIGTALAYTLWFRGVHALPATAVTFLGLLAPLVATAAGWLVLDQRLTAGQAIGATVVLAALVTAQLPPGKRPRTPTRHHRIGHRNATIGCRNASPCSRPRLSP